ncbi:MAG: hypothetical protein JW953_12895 [Anaerolineae bacterium]|nr:hypothetical protein [Anaerolineae bacterium]
MPSVFRLSTPAALGLVVILSIFVIAPLFYPGYIQTHSGFGPLWNVLDLRAAPSALTWTPHLALKFDPLRGDGLLAYYLAALLPFSPAAAIKIEAGLGWLLGGVGMFLWLRRWLGHPGALVAALVYTYLPYRLVAVYVRGAWGEALFWGLLPWAMLTTTSLITSPKLPFLIMTALVWFVLGLSQLGLTLWAFLVVVALLLAVYPKQSLRPILVALLGVGPALWLSLSLAAIPPSAPNFADHFLYPFQLFSAYWGFGPSRPGWNDGLSLQLGLAGVGLTTITLLLWLRPGGPANRADRRLLFFLTLAVALILLQLGVMAGVWRLPIWPGYTLANTLAYPWQLLGLTGLALAALAGAAVWLDEQLARLPLLGSIILVIILSSYHYLSPQFIRPRPEMVSGPQAQLGQAQLGAETQVALLAHDFSVLTGDHTAGLVRGQTAIPLAVHGPLRANDILSLNVTWHPLRPFAEDLKVFVHLVDPTGQVIAQFDGQPQSGHYPTSQWIPGELIADSYPLLFPANAPPGPYRVFVGLYHETTLTRLPVRNDAEGRVILDVE